jgi:hypothetical protein
MMIILYLGSDPEQWWVSLDYGDRLCVSQRFAGYVNNSPTTWWNQLSDRERIQVMDKWREESNTLA